MLNLGPKKMIKREKKLLLFFCMKKIFINSKMIMEFNIFKMVRDEIFGNIWLICVSNLYEFAGHFYPISSSEISYFSFYFLLPFAFLFFLFLVRLKRHRPSIIHNIFKSDLEFLFYYYSLFYSFIIILSLFIILPTNSLVFS